MMLRANIFDNISCTRNGIRIRDIMEASELLLFNAFHFPLIASPNNNIIFKTKVSMHFIDVLIPTFLDFA